MNKSPQYNHQSKSEVEGICIYQNMESASGHHGIYISEDKYLVGTMPERISSNGISKYSRSVILHSTKGAFMFTIMQPI